MWSSNRVAKCPRKEIKAISILRGVLARHILDLLDPIPRFHTVRYKLTLGLRLFQQEHRGSNALITHPTVASKTHEAQPNSCALESGKHIEGWSLPVKATHEVVLLSRTEIYTQKI